MIITFDLQTDDFRKLILGFLSMKIKNNEYSGNQNISLFFSIGFEPFISTQTNIILNFY